MKRLIYVKTLLNSGRVGLGRSMKYFMQFSFKSMIQQSNQDFIARIIYEDKSEKRVRRILKGYGNLPLNIGFINRKKSYGDLYNLIKDYEEFYTVRWDAGCVYHNNYIEKLIDYRHRENTFKIVNEGGYLFDRNKEAFIKVSEGKERVHVHINKVHEYLNLR